MTHIDWKAQSGKIYRYWFLENPTAEGIKAEPGNYAFVKKLANGNFTPLYFGETDDLRTRIPGHERWQEAVRLGATHIMGHTTQGGEQVRCDEERDLIQYWSPPLNVQHRQAR